MRDYPESRRRWTLEKFQRNQLQLGLKNVGDNDVIIVSDVDEILSSDALKRLVITPRKSGEVICFEQRWFQYYIDNELPFKWLRSGPRAGLFQTMRSPQALREVRGPILEAPVKNLMRGLRSSLSCRTVIRRRLMRDAGRHFSWIGGVQVIKRRALSITPHGDIAGELGHVSGAAAHLEAIRKVHDGQVADDPQEQRASDLGYWLAVIDAGYSKIIADDPARFSHLALASSID